MKTKERRYIFMLFFMDLLKTVKQNNELFYVKNKTSVYNAENEEIYWYRLILSVYKTAL